MDGSLANRLITPVTPLVGEGGFSVTVYSAFNCPAERALGIISMKYQLQKQLIIQTVHYKCNIGVIYQFTFDHGWERRQAN